MEELYTRKNSVTHRAPEAMARRRRHVTQKAAGMLAESRGKAARTPRESCRRTDGEQSRDASHVTRRAASMLAESRQKVAGKLPAS